jgi:hypothetical protein
MPDVIMTKVIPRLTIPVIAICLITFIRFAGFRKHGVTIDAIKNNKIKAIKAPLLLKISIYL